MMKGKVKVVNSKGYGFITADGIDFFFHHTAFDGTWKVLVAKVVKEGNDTVAVKFESDPTAVDGPRAINVSLIKG